MNLFVLLSIGIIIKVSEAQPTASTPEAITTIRSLADEDSSILNETSIALDPSSENVVKNLSKSDNEVPEKVQLPVDLLSGDILLDPSVILSRLERKTRDLKSVEELPEEIRDSLNFDRFNDGIPTFYYVRFVRVPRSTVDPEFEPTKNGHILQNPEEPEKTSKRFDRSADGVAEEDLHGADDGFIIRPLFKYRHEQLKRANRRGYRNKDSYYYYPRYPVFPGK